MAVDGGARPTSEVSVDRQPMMTFRQIMLMNVGFFGIQYSFGMQQCDPGQALLSVAEERGADLIVVGNRGINTLGAPSRLGPLRRVTPGALRRAHRAHDRGGKG